MADETSLNPGRGDAEDEAALLRRRKLLERARKGDSAAFSSLVGPLYSDLVNYARHKLGDCAAAADDVANEALVKAWKAIDRLENSDVLRSWLYRIAANCAGDHLRYVQRHPADSLNTPVSGDDGEETGGEFGDLIPDGGKYTDPRRKILAEEAQERVLKILEDMNPIHRDILVLYHVREMSYEQIATLLDIKIGTVMSRLSAARKQLRDRLGANPLE